MDQNRPRMKHKNPQQPMELADYISQVPRVRQVLGEKSMNYTLGAASSFIDKIQTNLAKSGTKFTELFNLSSSEGRVAKTVFYGSIAAANNKLIRTLNTLGLSLIGSGKVLWSKNLEKLNQKDALVMKSLSDKGYYSKAHSVKNLLLEKYTSIGITNAGDSQIYIKNDFSSRIHELRKIEPSNRTNTDMLRLLTLFHEGAHYEFKMADNKFSPTPGTLVPDSVKEKMAIEAINKWAFSEPMMGFRTYNELARKTVEETYCDTYAAMVLIKEMKDDPENYAKAIKAIELQAGNRAKDRIEHRKMYAKEVQDGLGISGTMYLSCYDVCEEGLKKVLEDARLVENMSVEEIKEMATTIASDSYMRIAKENSEITDIYVRGLMPGKAINTLKLAIQDTDKPYIQTVENHPAAELARYERKWFESRYGSFFDSNGPPTMETPISQRAVEASNNHSFTMTMDQIMNHETTPPRGMSEDVHRGRLRIGQSFIEEWKQANELVREVIVQYKATLDSQVKKTTLQATSDWNPTTDHQTPSLSIGSRHSV